MDPSSRVNFCSGSWSSMKYTGWCNVHSSHYWTIVDIWMEDIYIILCVGVFIWAFPSYTIVHVELQILRGFPAGALVSEKILFTYYTLTSICFSGPGCHVVSTLIRADANEIQPKLSFACIKNKSNNMATSVVQPFFIVEFCHPTRPQEKVVWCLKWVKIKKDSWMWDQQGSSYYTSLIYFVYIPNHDCEGER